MGPDSGRFGLKTIEKACGERLVHVVADLGRTHPAEFNSLGTGGERAGDDAAPEYQRDDLVPHVLIDARQTIRRQDQISNFVNLTDHTFLYLLAKLEHAAGRLPLTVVV